MWPGMQLQHLTTREPDATSSPSRSPRFEAVLDVERPADASAEDRIGMEVVA